MAISIPGNLPRHRFRHPAEFEVYQALVSGLRDDWIVIPSLEMRLEGSFADRELDILLMHRTDGLVLVEVKSFPMVVEGGRFFYKDGERLDRDPLAQMSAQRQSLTALLEDLDKHVYSKIRTVLASPETIAVRGQLPTHLRNEQLWGADQLADADEAMWRLISSDHFTQSLEDQFFEKCLQRLAPSAEFDISPSGLRAVARARMEQRLEAETKVLESLDANQRVMVTGGAGSGKTRLATAWARRAFGRGERVLFTCFNDPLGEVLRERLSAFEEIVVSPFLRYFVEAPGLPRAPLQGEDEDATAYWTRVEQWAMEHFNEITESFDTIVIDEAQDFSPIRMTMLEQLLDPDGPKRLLVVGDPVQSIRRTGFRPVTEQGGWVRAELTNNNRNAPAIATFLRRNLGGAPSPNDEPFGSEVLVVEANGDEQIVKAVQSALEDRPDDPTWVLTTSANTRDLLRWRLGLVSWERRAEAPICETVYRIKGLETERVILVGHPAETEPRTKQLLNAGASRALDSLVIVAPDVVAGLLRS
jgi:AAA domain/Nuclease-related domain